VPTPIRPNANRAARFGASVLSLSFSRKPFSREREKKSIATYVDDYSLYRLHARRQKVTARFSRPDPASLP
jgi:hypothetical protein